MFLSQSDLPCRRSLALSAFIFVLLAHVGLIWALSSKVTATHEPTASIKMLESFVMVDATGQAVSTPTETLDPVAPIEPEEVATLQPEEPIPESHDPLNLPAPESTAEESQISLPDDFPKEHSPKEDRTPKLVEPQPQQTPPVVSKKAPPKNAQPNPKNQQSSPSAKISQHSAAPSQTGSSDITLPVTHAKYLNNPHPAYPRQSKRLGEQGTVLLAVEIDVDGTAAQVKVQKSSGHPRLDRTALETVLKWRFISGQKAGVPQKMWVNIPINFVLE